MMMRIRSRFRVRTRPSACLLALVGGFVLAGIGFPDGDRIRLALPGDSLAVEVGSYTICGSAPSGVARVEVRTPAGESMIDAVDGTFAVPLDLSPGNNPVVITVPGGDSVTVNLFLLREGETPPDGARALETHDFGLPEDIAGCRACHPEAAMKDNVWDRIQAREGACTPDCHEETVEHPHLHGPAAAGSCVSCHDPHGSGEPLFLVASEDELCSRCHETREQAAASLLHFPFEEGECGSCHSPHGGESRYLLPSRNLSEVCFSCHDEGEMTGESRHAPVEEGDCSMCHQPHGSDHPGLLLLEQRELCLDCHGEIAEMLELGKPHPPVEAECTGCHRPHSAPSPPLLRTATLDLCAECHADTIEAATEAAFKHPPVGDGRCGACHGVHGAARSGLLREERPRLCYECHPEVGESIRRKAFRHSPVEDGDCGSCHENTHGGDSAGLLAAALEPDFYTEYSERSYEFCFLCHDSDLVEEEQTRSATGFRDGERNLHFVHVHRDKGRTCRACHDPHASDQERLIREGVPFGNWTIPIRYSVSPQGGRCETGCHRPQTYTR